MRAAIRSRMRSRRAAAPASPKREWTRPRAAAPRSTSVIRRDLEDTVITPVRCELRRRSRPMWSASGRAARAARPTSNPSSSRRSSLALTVGATSPPAICALSRAFSSATIAMKPSVNASGPPDMPSALTPRPRSTDCTIKSSAWSCVNIHSAKNFMGSNSAISPPPRVGPSLDGPLAGIAPLLVNRRRIEPRTADH